MSIKNYLDGILHSELFEYFSREELSDIFGLYSYRIERYSKDTIVYLQNQRCDTLDIILQGEIQIQRIDKSGDILTVSSFFGGDHLGANLLFAKDNTYPMTVISKTPVTLLHIESSLVLGLCQSHKEFLLKFLQSLSDRTLVLTDKLHTLSTKTIRQRIIDYLTYEYYLQNSLRIKLTMTKKDLSERLGVQRPSLQRELSKMRADGILDYNAKYITIKDMAVLNTAL